MTQPGRGTNIIPMLSFQTTPEDDTVSVSELSGLTLADWLWAGGIMLVAILVGLTAARLAARIIERHTSKFIARLIGRLVGALFMAIGFIYALNQLGVSVGPLLGLLGLAGLALALAFQNLLENVIAGVFMSIRRPFEAGDQVSTVGFDGTVESINLREVALVTFDGVRVHLPNAEVWAQPIVNFTELGTRRTTLEVGVSYDTHLDEAQAAILDVLHSTAGVADAPAPEAPVHEFGNSSINFAVRFWHEPDIASEWRVRDLLARSIKQRFDRDGITIPFPQRVVHMAPPAGDGEQP